MISNDEQQLNERFYQYVTFGTCVMRGLLSVGTNRMNLYTIHRVTEGLLRYIKEHGETAKKRCVVIAFDTSYFSCKFACKTARVLGAHGIYS